MAQFIVKKIPKGRHRSAYHSLIIFVNAETKAGALKSAMTNADFAENSPFGEYSKPVVQPLVFNQLYYL